ncbi:MAG: 4Fe-4S binding protein [Methanosarcinaceae archaeon]|nr:4Fe-4S binding protein [Methanosarcinaceae archaeon]MDF1534040.1 4Fe-4S binding protein [Methanosarcinaceae archaeon]
MKIRINVAPDIVVTPIIAEVILETRTLLNISQAHIDSTKGEIIADVPIDEFDKIKSALTSRGAKITIMDKPISRDEDECVECGACVSVCPVKVFTFGEDWSVNLDEGNCIQCGTCIEMCPHGALTLEQ